jgi:hypothetical protein
MGLVVEQILKMVSGRIRLPASAVHHALGLEPGHAASAYYQCDRPRDALVDNAALDGCGNPLESFRTQADGFRFGGRQLLRERRGGHDPYKNKGRILLMAPSKDRAGALGFRCVMDEE